jgi:uncharacterized protein (DUF1501 family)
MCLGGLATSGLPEVHFARVRGSGRLVFVLLRGGFDGLAAVAPTFDPDYYDLRRSLAVERDGLLELADGFALTPGLGPLRDFWDRDELLVLHAMAIPFRTRSHFDGQAVLETGLADPSGSADGWLNRLLQIMEGERSGIAVAAGMPRSLMGEGPVTTWSPAELGVVDDAYLDRLHLLYRSDPALLGQFEAALGMLDVGEGAEAMSTGDGARGDGVLGDGVVGDGVVGDGMAGSDDPTGGGMTGDDPVGEGMAGPDEEAPPTPRRGGRASPESLFRATARLMTAPDGPNVAAMEFSGWDTHANQGRVGGNLDRQLGRLAEGLAAFREAMGPEWQGTTVVVMTEFGRTARPNGSGGTDHGTAGAGFVLGSRVAGSRVVTDWPGLSDRALYEARDLAPTLDTRAVLKAVLAGTFDLTGAQTDRVFPGSGGVRGLWELMA